MEENKTNPAEELKSLIEGFNAKQVEISEKQTALEEALNAKDNTEVVDSLKSEIETMKKSLIKSNEIILKQGEAMNKMNIDTTPKAEGRTSLSQKLNGAVEEIGTKWDQFKSGEISAVTIELKDVFNQKGAIDIADFQNSTISQAMPGVGKKPVRNIVVEPLFRGETLGNMSRGNITYTDQDTLTRNAATVDRCSTIPESDINWIEQSVPMQKIGDSIPVCKDALEDMGILEAELRNFLLENVALELDNQLLLGDGVSPNLKGVDSVAPNWAAGTFATSIPTPSVYDVISTGVNQIKCAGEGSFFQPDVTLMHCDDVEEMRLTKDADGNYLIPPFADLSNFTIRGTRIIESTLVPQNQAYIGDFTYGTVWTSRNMTLEIANQHGDDFLEDCLRFKATTRKALVIRNVHAAAFLHVASISQAITDLTKP